MDFSKLGLNRLLTKSSQSTDLDAVQMSKDSGLNKFGNDERATPGVLTGTVISDCIFYSTYLPARIQIKGNDMFFYDDTVGGGGTITGDTSKISFLRSYDNTKGFIIQTRAGKNNNAENVLEVYGLPPASGYSNYIYIGRNGQNTTNSQTGYIQIQGNSVTSRAAAPANGTVGLAVSIDGADPAGMHVFATDARNFGLTAPGVVSAVMGSDNGVGGIGHYTHGIGMWDDGATIVVGCDVLPQTSGVYNIGDASNKFNFFGTLAACPLPTVNDALSVIDRIPEPVEVGDRGHFGPGLYIDDLTFPEEILYEIKGKKEIELTKMVGLLTKAVMELNKKVKDLERMLNL